MRSLVLFALLLLGLASAYAQGELDEQKKIFYRNEKSASLMLTSNGLSINFRLGKYIDGYRKKLYDLDVAFIKHPKEYKFSTIGSGNFVYGKLNTVIDFRPGIGFQKEQYRKNYAGGISVRYLYNYGVSIALLKPVYYVVEEPYIEEGVVMYREVVARFNPELHNPELIQEKASFFKGFSEIKVLPGLWAKASVSFEFSKRDAVIHAIEAGIVVEAFPKEIEIMANTSNKAIFLHLFAAYRFGKVVDARNIKTKAEKKEEW